MAGAQVKGVGQVEVEVEIVLFDEHDNPYGGDDDDEILNGRVDIFGPCSRSGLENNRDARDDDAAEICG